MVNKKEIFAGKEGQNITTIKLAKSTKARLDNLRIYKHETYEEILQKMLELLNVCRSAPERARSYLVDLDRQRKNLIKTQHDI